MFVSCPGTLFPWVSLRPPSSLLPSITALCLHQRLDYLDYLNAPSSRDRLLFSSRRGKPRFLWLFSTPGGFGHIYIYIFNFFCRLREISRNFFLSVIRLHKKNQLLGVLERRALSDCTLSTLVGDTKLGGGGDTPC